MDARKLSALSNAATVFDAFTRPKLSRVGCVSEILVYYKPPCRGVFMRIQSTSLEHETDMEINFRPRSIEILMLLYGINIYLCIKHHKILLDGVHMTVHSLRQPYRLKNSTIIPVLFDLVHPVIQIPYLI